MNDFQSSDQSLEAFQDYSQSKDAYIKRLEQSIEKIRNFPQEVLEEQEKDWELMTAIINLPNLQRN